MSKLFQPAIIGSLEIKNRIVRSATAERLADDITGFPKPSLQDLWINLARGGAGLIITGHMYVHISGKCHPEMTGIHDDRAIPIFQDIVNAVHKEGAKIAVQINHGGMQCSREAVLETIAPSDVDFPFLPQPARSMKEEEISMIIDSYAQAARRANVSGFDAIQIHAAHGYLINQFTSPLVNRREDNWGGDYPRRLTFLKEVIKVVREQVGIDFPVFIKFGMQDFIDGGLTVDVGSKIVSEMEEMGLDAVEVSGGIQANNTKKGINSKEKEAYYRPFARKIKELTNFPVILVGGLRSKEIMEDVLESGDADFVSLSRPLINTPNFPNLMRIGQIAVSDCISSNNCWPQAMGEGIACKCPTLTRQT